jgi:hypothetical protein
LINNELQIINLAQEKRCFVDHDAKLRTTASQINTLIKTNLQIAIFNGKVVWINLQTYLHQSLSIG